MPLSRVKPEDYQKILAEKVRAVTSLLAPFSPPAPIVYFSAPTAFRQRAEFRIWHEGSGLNYVMFRKDEPKVPVAIVHFPIADANIQHLMPPLLRHLENSGDLRRKLFQAEFLSTLAGEVVITLAYHRKLDREWENAAQKLREKLASEVSLLSIVGRSRKQKVVLGNDYVNETLHIGNTDYHYRQYEQSFTQPNAKMNIHMIEWACEQASRLQGDMLELYCGNGNFTLPLAQHCDNIIATELSKASVRAARFNLQENSVENVQLVRLSAQEVAMAMGSVREFRRLAELPKPLRDYDLKTIFVDPPRAGLDADTLAMAGQFRNIIYISCNPQTLAENLHGLAGTHRISQFAAFDQFPYTDHLECGVLLEAIR